ncbi:hypothetical protein L596_014015 [Steinernema carpocapsae]|uniref:Uncharacterized protein n=1 Tax=Steinernema carpocapsae TaxID=34508 RepID=A0A4U5NA63_STECR|nr:hypothetical protein L596_014015 [Steinernema carpocapsae]
MTTLTVIVVVNNSSSTALVMNAFAINLLLVTHVNNALALIFFNPEVRVRFTSKIGPPAITPYNKESNGTAVRLDEYW